jgi:hypothetical protein
LSAGSFIADSKTGHTILGRVACYVGTRLLINEFVAGVQVRDDPMQRNRIRIVRGNPGLDAMQRAEVETGGRPASSGLGR